MRAEASAQHEARYAEGLHSAGDELSHPERMPALRRLAEAKAKLAKERSGWRREVRRGEGRHPVNGSADP